ncbi:MAG: bifunctional nuclease family protein [Candidatus Aminicenantes bacterium]|jgi:bifunctional DNase/RNase|nr:bifunctional nuclease family protein [Candidatus Aminicenantes bacterium]
MEQFVEVNVVGLIMDQISKSPVMVLKPLNDKKIIPIWIGMAEANSIALELESIPSPRPMAHDLINCIMSNLEAVLTKVIITNIVENTYYAELYIEKEGRISTIDCRPSDAVALALKNGVKIYVSSQILETSVLADVFSNLLSREEKIDNWFNSLTPNDFGEIEQ